MKRLPTFAALCLAILALALPAPCQSQQDQAPGARKVVNRVAPDYPRIARTMNLRGIVKVEALVASNGAVKSVDVKGGNPVLAQAAVGAIRQWKFEPGHSDTREPIEVKFDPNQ